MPSAALLGYRGCRGGVDLAGAIGPFDLPTVEPVPDRGYRAVGRLRHLTQRGPAGRELLEQLLVGSSARREPACHDPNASSGGGRSAYASSAVPASASAPPEDFSNASVLDSIWRTRSRVTPTSWPMSSSVIGSSSPNP